jgi:flap endonuclease-1
MSIYQFLIAVRQNGENLTNDNGETTSHLMGMFYRTIRMVENGIKPVYVFDGKPPQMKSKELEKRLERRTEAEAEMSKAAEAGKNFRLTKYLSCLFTFIKVMKKPLINMHVELLKLLVNIMKNVNDY